MVLVGSGAGAGERVLDALAGPCGRAGVPVACLSAGVTGIGDETSDGGDAHGSASVVRVLRSREADDEAAAELMLELPAPRPQATALVLHTSGTTGRPKQVPLAHANLVASMTNIVDTYTLRYACGHARHITPSTRKPAPACKRGLKP